MNVIVNRRILKTRTERLRAECAECGLDAEEVTVEMGEHVSDLEDIQTLRFCLPCLKRAVAEAEAAVARDKGA